MSKQRFASLLLLVCACGIAGCSSSRLNSNGTPIEISNIESVVINNMSAWQDSLGENARRLSQLQVTDLLGRLNSSKHAGPIKGIKRHYIEFRFTDGTNRTFSSCGNYLLDNNIYGYDIGDVNYVDSLWNHLNHDYINNIRKVFEEYIEYSESTDSPENLNMMQDGLQTLDVVRNTEDLDLLLNVWMYYSITDFDATQFIPEILKRSKPQSIEAVKNRVANKKEWETEDGSPYSDLKSLLKILEEE